MRRTVVHQGETLESIAHRLWGDFRRWRELAVANDIRDPARLTVGQILRVP